MTVEVRELIIRATIEDDNRANKATVDPETAQQALIEACVEQVLEILRMRDEP